MRRKGLFGEELPATLMTAILLLLFIAASISAYGQFFGRMGLVERERAASSMTEHVFYSLSGHGPEEVLEMFKGREGMMVKVTDMENGNVFSAGSLENMTSASVSSSPLLLHNSTEGRDHLGRLEIYAGN